MHLINCKIHLELTWSKNSVISSVAGTTTFQIKSTKLYIPVVTLKTKDNVNLIKKGFERSVYWNEYKSKIESQEADANILKRCLLDASFQGVNRLFVMAFGNTNGENRVERDNHIKYFMSRINLKGCKFLIDGRKFYGQAINDQARKYNELRKVTTGKGDDYTTGFLLDYDYFFKAQPTNCN